MSYLVLARKYRPGTFADIVGQDHVVRTLQNAISLDRVHHAFLFTGARGVGKTTTARVLARALNCEKGPTIQPCGTCAGCREIASSSSPDVLEIDGASNRGVDNVRELRETVRYMPSRGRFKLYIIDEVHQLTSEAFNALLKTLEEPPAHVKFIFATTEPQKIPATILSRVQRFDFRRVSIQVLTEHLRGILDREESTLSKGALAAIVREAQGSVRDALSLLDQVLSYAGGKPDDAQVIEALGVVDRDVVFALCDAIMDKDADRLLSLIADVDLRGHDLGELGGLLVEHYRDLMVAKVTKDAQRTLLDRSPGELDTLQKQAAKVSRPDLHRYFSALVSVAEDVSRSAFPRVSLEMGLLRLLEVESSVSLTSLIQRIDDLVSGGGASGSLSPRAVEEGVTEEVTKASSVPPAELEPGWEGLVDRVRRARPALASVLEHGRPTTFGPEGVEIVYEAGTFYWESARDRDNRALLERMLAEHFGRRTPLTLTTSGQDGPVDVATLAEVKDRRDEDSRQQIEKGALEHPAVRGAISILGGEVKEVIPLATSAEDVR